MVMATKTPQGARLNPQNTLELSQGMSIQTAIDTADAHGGNWVILIYPGTYDEADLTPNGGADITIKGIGEGRVVINPTVTVPVTAVIVSGFTLLLEDITVTARDAALPALRVTGGACEACDCELNGVGVGDAIQMVAGTLLLNDSDVPVGDVDLSTAGCTLTAIDTNFDGTIDTAGAAVAHTITMFSCDLGGQTLNLAATGACAYTFHNCMSMSTITDASLLGTGHLCQCDVVGAGLVKNGTTTWIVDNSGLIAVTNANATGEISVYGGVVLTVTSSAGIIHLAGCFYRNINRSVTGNIVDESPWLGDAPWRVQKWSWQAALANSQVAVRGSPVDGGSGQVLLEVTLNAGVGFREEAVELLTEGATGARDNSFLPARTPRMLTQFLWDRTGANQFLFIGLRETLGDVMPAGGGAEHCAGFCWDGAQFFTRTDDGVNHEDSVFAAPGHTNPVQLEIIIFGGVRVEFYMDGVLVATHTVRVPTAALDWQHLHYTDGGGAATDVEVEVRNGGVQECPS